MVSLNSSTIIKTHDESKSSNSTHLFKGCLILYESRQLFNSKIHRLVVVKVCYCPLLSKESPLRIEILKRLTIHYTHWNHLWAEPSKALIMHQKDWCSLFRPSLVFAYVYLFWANLGDGRSHLYLESFKLPFQKNGVKFREFIENDKSNQILLNMWWLPVKSHDKRWCWSK